MLSSLFDGFLTESFIWKYEKRIVKVHGITYGFQSNFDVIDPVVVALSSVSQWIVNVHYN